MKISIPGYGVVHDDETPAESAPAVVVDPVPTAEPQLPVAAVPDVAVPVLEIIANPTPSPELVNNEATGAVEDPINAKLRAHLAAEAAAASEVAPTELNGPAVDPIDAAIDTAIDAAVRAHLAAEAATDPITQ